MILKLRHAQTNSPRYTRCQYSWRSCHSFLNTVKRVGGRSTAVLYHRNYTSLVYLLVASESAVLHINTAVSQFLTVIAKNAVTAQSTYFIPTFGPSEMSPTHLSRHFIYKTTIIRQTHIFTPLKENVFEANRRFDSRENNQYSP